MSAPAPRENPILLGHEEAEATLAAAITSGRLHHAWLVTGAHGIGKATLAFRFARRLLAGPSPDGTLEVAPNSPTFRRVAAGSHADLLTVELAYDAKRKKMKSQIAVDDVRRITDFMALTPAEDGWRVAIVDGAEDLNQSSANALLKILEEPPRRAILVLTCAAPGRLPATIRSRCRRLRLASVPDAAMAELLARYLPDMPDADRARLVAVSDGSPGRALMLAEEEGLRLATLADEVLASLPALSPLRAYEVADALGRADDAFSTFMDLLRASLAAAVRQAARGRADTAQARLAALRPLDAWAELWHALTRLQDDTERLNLDKRQAVVTGLGLLAGAQGTQ